MPTYTVKPGDTLYKISRATGYGVDELANYNRIDPNMIRVGQQLRIPYRYPGAEMSEAVPTSRAQIIEATPVTTAQAIQQANTQTPVNTPVTSTAPVMSATATPVTAAPSFPWSATAPSNLPNQAQNLYTGQTAYNLIEQTFPNEPLNALHKHIVELEGYSPGWYQLPGDVPTVGVGQVATYTSMTPRQAMDAKIEELKSFMPEFDNASEERQKGLLSAYYRGDMGPSSQPQSWPQKYSDYIANPTQKNKDAAYKETWNSNEYRKRQARIEWRIANGHVKADGTPDQSVSPYPPTHPEYQKSLIDVGVMNRVNGWMDTLYGTHTPEADAQAKIDQIEATF